MKISIVIPSLPNSTHLNERCIESYLETASSEIDVVLVENDATFAVNVNEGVRAAKGGFICVVNNDSIALPEWDTQVAKASRDGIASFTPRADCGWAFAASKALWEEVGLLDEALVNSYEDYDFFIRAALRGKTRILAPKHFAVHDGGMTLDQVWGHNRKQSKQRLAQCRANREYMMQKWPGLNVDAVPLLYWAIYGVTIMQEWSKGRVEVSAP